MLKEIDIMTNIICRAPNAVHWEETFMTVLPFIFHQSRFRVLPAECL